MFEKKEKWISRWKKKASYTVEISIILPFLAGIIILIFYLGFYLNDRFILEETVSEAAIYAASNYGNDSEKIKNIAVDRCREISAHKFYVVKNPSFAAEIKNSRVIVSGKMVFEVPILGALKNKIWGGDVTFKCEGMGTITRPVRNILIVDGIKGVTSVDKAD